jgi:hypothetical protein
MTKMNIRYGLCALIAIVASWVLGTDVLSLRAQETTYTPVTDERLRSPDASVVTVDRSDVGAPVTADC